MSCGHVVSSPGCDWCAVAEEARRQRGRDEERLRLDRQRLALQKETLRLQRDAALSAQSDRNDLWAQRRAAQDQAQRDAAAEAEAERSRRAKEHYSTLRPPLTRERWLVAGGAAAVSAAVLWVAAAQWQALSFVVGGTLALLIGWVYLRYRRGGWWLVRRFGALDVTMLGTSFGSALTRSGTTAFATPSSSVTLGQVVGISVVALIVGGLGALLARTPAIAPAR